VAVPAEDWDDPRTFDAVLLDAPCTATGTFRRNPEVLRATKPADVGPAVAAAAAVGVERVLSIAAGVSTASIESAAGAAVPVVRRGASRSGGASRMERPTSK
jgi:hypothetical protein